MGFNSGFKGLSCDRTSINRKKDYSHQQLFHISPRLQVCTIYWIVGGQYCAADIIQLPPVCQAVNTSTFPVGWDVTPMNIMHAKLFPVPKQHSVMYKRWLPVGGQYFFSVCTVDSLEDHIKRWNVESGKKELRNHLGITQHQHRHEILECVVVYKVTTVWFNYGETQG